MEDTKQEMLKKERERVKDLINDKIEGVNRLCEKRWSKAKKNWKHRRKVYYMVLPRSDIIRLFERLAFLVDNPKYKITTPSPKE